MDPIVGGALIQGASNTISGLLGNSQRKKAQDRAFKHNKKMWHMQNEYNTPKNQMARFVDAGLNKNLMYGQGTHGNASNTPQYQAPKVENIESANYQQMAMDRHNAKLMSANTANVKAQTQNHIKDNELKTLQAIQLTYGNQSAKAKAYIDTVTANYSVQAQELNIKQLEENIRSTAEGTKLTKQNRGKVIAEVKRIMSENNLNTLDYEYLKKNKSSRHESGMLKTVKEITETLQSIFGEEAQSIINALSKWEKMGKF